MLISVIYGTCLSWLGSGRLLLARVALQPFMGLPGMRCRGKHDFRCKTVAFGYLFRGWRCLQKRVYLLNGFGAIDTTGSAELYCILCSFHSQIWKVFIRSAPFHGIKVLLPTQPPIRRRSVFWVFWSTILRKKSLVCYCLLNERHSAEHG